MDFAASTPPASPQPAPDQPVPEWRIADAPVPYPDAVTRMQADIAAIRAGGTERVWLLEHPALYTAGTSARADDLADPKALPVFAAGRGGQWTYHGPGQRVGYVMLDLDRPHGTVPRRDLHGYVQGLEDWLLLALDRFNIRGERRPGRVGVWVADRVAGTEKKIAAIGVRVTRWVTWHGVSLNVSPNLHHYDGIVPCGIREHGVTSLHELGLTATIEDVDLALMASWPGVFGGAANTHG
jgi:lipoyl(octanoyl) transferase